MSNCSCNRDSCWSFAAYTWKVAPPMSVALAASWRSSCWQSVSSRLNKRPKIPSERWSPGIETYIILVCFWYWDTCNYYYLTFSKGIGKKGSAIQLLYSLAFFKSLPASTNFWWSLLRVASDLEGLWPRVVKGTFSLLEVISHHKQQCLPENVEVFVTLVYY